MKNFPLTQIKGIGEKRAKVFAKLGIYTLYDLLNYFPRNYIDMTRPTPICSLVSGESAVVVGKVCSPVTEKRVRGDMLIYTFSVTDADPKIDDGHPSRTDTVRVTLFNRKFLAASIKEGQELTLIGKAMGLGFFKEISSPTIFTGKQDGLRPQYPLTKDITQQMIYAPVKTLFDTGKSLISQVIPENLPSEIIEKFGLISRTDAYEKIHFPSNWNDVLQARKRLGFEELFIFRLGLSVLKRKHTVGKATHIKPQPMDEVGKLFPFELTPAQQKAITEAATDMAGSIPMARLVQGDVGSGKTAVAAALCYNAIKSGYQACLMVPTELLAIQHADDLNDILSPHGITVGLLTGSVTAAQKKKIKQKLKAGEIDLLIGTHAMIEPDVEFKNLALAVTDEQHRFGVKQRAVLAEKCADGLSPHVLVMSATPIPRSLAMVLYGDLSVSVIDMLPKGRKKVSTFLLSSEANDRMYGYVTEEAKKGFQSYIVCPLVEEGEDTTVKAVEGFFEELKEKYFAETSAAFIHGRMKPKDKDRILREFAENKISVLVSTTVIEVGVNVPNATVMIIQNAERFGLSQLHQLRGRVGRGKQKSYCFLISDTQSEQTLQRLNALCSTNDGFEIARADLEQRGPGDFFGVRQHGIPMFKMADMLSDLETVEAASDTADTFVKNTPNWFKEEKYAPLRRSVSEFFARSEGC